MKTTQNKQRELTKKESLVSLLGLVIMFLLAAIPDNDLSLTAGLRLAAGIMLGIALMIWQHKRINSRNDGERGL